MASEITRAHYDRNRENILAYEAALDRGLPKTLIPLLGGKKAFTPPEFPDYDTAIMRRNVRETFSPVTGTRYDSAHEKDQFVDHIWWKDKKKGIIQTEEISIGGAKALDHQKHLDELGDMGLSREDVDGLDQS